SSPLDPPPGSGTPRAQPDDLWSIWKPRPRRTERRSKRCTRFNLSRSTIRRSLIRQVHIEKIGCAAWQTAVSNERLRKTGAVYRRRAAGGAPTDRENTDGLSQDRPSSRVIRQHRAPDCGDDRAPCAGVVERGRP